MKPNTIMRRISGITTSFGDLSDLDLVFYRTYYGDLAEMDDAALAAHYRNYGKSEGRYPNNAAAVLGFQNDPEMPYGFSAQAYLAANLDVRDSVQYPAQALAHFKQHGISEQRAAYDGSLAVPSFDKSTRALTGADRKDWRKWLAIQFEKDSHADVLAAHPRMAYLPGGFNLASYIAHNITDLPSDLSPYEAFFHFLEFGLEDGLRFEPAALDLNFIDDYHNITINRALPSATQVVSLKVTKGRLPWDLIYLNAGELMASYGFSGVQLDTIFDHEYYHALASADAPDLPLTRAACAEHFCTKGFQKLLPLHQDYVFDPEFYVTRYSDALHKYGLAIAGYSPSDILPIYVHYLQVGIADQMQPNLHVDFEHEFDVRLPQDIDDLLAVYRLEHDALPADAKDFHVLNEIATNCNRALFMVPVTSTPIADFLTALADKYATSGREGVAEKLYWVVVNAGIGAGRAKRHLGDLYQRQGKDEVALMLRREMLTNASHRNEWTFVHVANSLKARGDMLGASQIWNFASDATPGDYYLSSNANESAKQAFDHIWGRLPKYIAAYGVEQTQSDLKRALDYCAPTVKPVTSHQPVKKVALIANLDLPQCKLYRVDQKADHLRAAGYEVAVFGLNTGIDSFIEQMKDFEAAIFFRVPAFPKIIDAITGASQYGIATFYEIDDVVFDTDHFPPAFKTYAGTITQTQYDAMACGVPLFAKAMQLCDYGIASTPTIQTLMQKFVRTGQVFVHRNALGQLHEFVMETEQARVKDTATKPIRIFYGSGTKAHKQDFHEIIEPALAAVAEKYGKKVEIFLVGHFGEFKALDPKRHNLRSIEPIWDFEDYCALLAKSDINLSVLAPSLVTDAKSEIKWMEAAMLGIPSVVSRTATHSEVIRDGETGYLCDDAADFTKHLMTLMGDADLRQKIGEQAKQQVFAEYSVQTMASNIKGILTAVTPEQKVRKKLLVVNVFYPPQSIGGATRVVRDNVTLLKEQYGDEFDIDVLCTLQGGPTPYEIQHYAHNGVRVFSITSASIPNVDQNPKDPKMAEAFTQCLSQIKPDLIHFHCIQRLTASIADVARQQKIPYVITAHDGWWISKNQFLIDDDDKISTYDYRVEAFDSTAARNVRLGDLRKPLFGAKKVLAVSPSFEKIYKDAGVEHTITIENGVSHLPSCDRKPSASGRVRLAHIGGMSRHKGFHLVKSALLANTFENLELLVIDHAMNKGEMRQEVWGATEVTFKAKLEQGDVGLLYGMIDVLLAPSLWPESYGLVTREALSTGAWVVASDRGAVGADVIEGENGYIVSPDSYVGLSGALAKINADPETYRNPPAIETTLRIVDAQVAETVALYREILDGE
ncbi:glycosyltransferase [Algirhabdus cladophorae]|uniref:glycosyltransferase n=1 Tax=Algirhabdus cladophorae TaxID=3377108 RepID=UPI003B8491DF